MITLRRWRGDPGFSVGICWFRRPIWIEIWVWFYIWEFNLLFDGSQRGHNAQNITY